MGHGVSANGVHVHPEKIRAATDLGEPKNVVELRRFLGIVNYISKFLPNVTALLHPLRNLLKKDVTWSWSEAQQTSFNTIISNLTKAPVLAFYDPR